LALFPDAIFANFTAEEFAAMGLLAEFKRAAAARYVRRLERFDPRFAVHVLTAQSELFSAARAFFASEEEHARRAAGKVRERAAASDDTSGSPS